MASARGLLFVGNYGYCGDKIVVLYVIRFFAREVVLLEAEEVSRTRDFRVMWMNYVGRLKCFLFYYFSENRMR